MAIIYRPKGRALEYSFLAANIYRGCSHGCKYCYAPAVLRMNLSGFSKNPQIRKNILKELENDADKYEGTDERVLLCFTCDPYQPLSSCGITRSAIEILAKHKIPFQVLTKGGMRAVKDFDLYGPNDAFATTMTFLDANQSLEWEPGAALPADRISAIKEAHWKYGIDTWVSLEPVIDPEQSLRVIDETHEFVNLYKIGRMNHRQSDIDWRSFGQRAIELCEKHKTSYYIKDDLAKELNGIEFTNTDTRKVVRQ